MSPAIHLTPGEKTGTRRLGSDRPVVDGKGEGNISSGDLAAAIVDEAEAPRHVRTRFTLGY